MQFAIALVTYFQQHGFDTIDWRKSIDGTQALVHLEYAKTLISDIETDNNVTIYNYPSAELDEFCSTVYGS